MLQQSLHPSGNTLLLSILSFALVLALLWLAPLRPIIADDSIGYIDFHAVRTAIYPLFLDLFGVANAAWGQIIIFGVTALGLALAIERLTGSIWLSSTVLVALFMNPEVNRFHSTVLTESLFISTNALMLAAAVMYVKARDWRWIVLAATLAGVAAAIRPAGFLLGPIVAMAAYFMDPRRSRTAALCLSAWAGVIAAERTYSYGIHGRALTSLTAVHLFAKASLIEAPPTNVQYLSHMERRLTDVLERDAKPVRALLDPR